MYAEEQNGFKNRHSCSDILSLYRRNRNSQKKYTFIAFLNVEKAFHSVDWDLLLYKLLLGMCTVSNVLYRIGIIKLIPVSYQNDRCMILLTILFMMILIRIELVWHKNGWFYFYEMHLLFFIFTSFGKLWLINTIILYAEYTKRPKGNKWIF